MHTYVWDLPHAFTIKRWGEDGVFLCVLMISMWDFLSKNYNMDANNSLRVAVIQAVSHKGLKQS